MKLDSKPIDGRRKHNLLGLRVMTVSGLIAMALGLLIVILQPRPDGLVHTLLFWVGASACIVAIASMVLQVAISIGIWLKIFERSGRG